MERTELGLSGVEQCANFRREFTKTTPYRENSFCSVAGTNMGCNSYSDACPIPESFVPRLKKAPILGCEEMGSFPIVENLPPLNADLLAKQIQDQAYNDFLSAKGLQNELDAFLGLRPTIKLTFVQKLLEQFGIKSYCRTCGTEKSQQGGYYGERSYCPNKHG